MSSRLDDTLRELARVEAPDDLSARVRVALEQGAASAAWWPKVAAAAVVVMVAVGGWLANDRGGGASAPRSAPHAARVPPPAVERAASASAEAALDEEAPPPRKRVRVRMDVQAADHEHALPSLAEIAAAGPAALTTPPMTVEATEIVPLAPIAPMEIPALDADEGERR